MNVQPKPSACPMPGRHAGDRQIPVLQPRGRVPVLVTGSVSGAAWPIAFEVEPWRP